MFTGDVNLMNVTRPEAPFVRVVDVLRQADARFSWLVLIPRQPDLVELEDLNAAERAVLMEEVIRAGRAVRVIGEALDLPVEKLNVGALGNVVRQLHVHVIGRRPGDPQLSRCRPRKFDH